MNKSSYLLISLIILLLGAIGVTWYVQNFGTTVTTVAPVYTDLTVSLPSSAGKNVLVNNFLKDPTVTLDTQNAGSYFLGNTFTANSEAAAISPYVVTFEAQTGYFNITLLERPFATTRLAAEAYLKNLLEVDETKLCGLSYSVSVPGYVDNSASGIDYRFSFCPDSIPLR